MDQEIYDYYINKFGAEPLPRSIHPYGIYLNGERTRKIREVYPDLNSVYGSYHKKGGELETFMGKFDNGRLEKLAGLTNIRILTPDRVTDGKFSNEKTQENYVRNNAVYGADETVDVPAVADIGDEILFCCPTVARYGEKWYLVSVSSVTSIIIGIDSTLQAFICAKGTLADYLP